MMTASAPAGMLPVILLGTIVLGIISGLVGKKLLRPCRKEIAQKAV